MYKIHAKIVFKKKINKKKLNTLKKNRGASEQCKRIALFTIFNMNSAISCTVYVNCAIT
jgi:hypothetical protein